MATDAQRPVSDRIQLARLAEQAIALTERVTATAGADGRWTTTDGDRTITGVIAAEDGRGQVEVALHLVALWPPEPFDHLGDELRQRMRRSARMTGLGDRLGALPITFHDVRVSL